MSVTPTPTLPVVTATGRTLTAIGTIYIADIRPRTPNAGASLVFTQTFDGLSFDVYAKADDNNTYSLLALTLGTDVSGRRDVTRLGVAVDYPSLGRTEWKPATGGAYDGRIAVSADGKQIVTGKLASDTLTTGVGLYVDGAGHINSRVNVLPSAVVGAGAGNGSIVSFRGTDQAGCIGVSTGSAPAPAALNTVLTFTFGTPFVTNAPNAVLVTPGNNNTAWLARNQDCYVLSNGIFLATFRLVANQVALAPGTIYIWNYLVIGGD